MPSIQHLAGSVYPRLELLPTPQFPMGASPPGYLRAATNKDLFRVLSDLATLTNVHSKHLGGVEIRDTNRVVVSVGYI